MKKAKVFRPTAFAFPYIAVTVVFVIVPLLLLTVYAFRGNDGSFSVENFTYIFTNEAYRNSLFKTVGIAFLATLLCLLVSYPVACVLASAPFNKMAVLALLFVIPMWMNFVLRIVALKSVFTWMGLKPSFRTGVIGLVYDFLPYMLLPIYTVLSNLDKSYVEASKDLGSNEFLTFWKVTFPLSIPGIISGVSMVFMPIFSAYAVTGLLADAGTTVIGRGIEQLFSQPSGYGAGSALSFVLLLLVFLVMFASSAISRKANKTLKGAKKK